MQLSKYKSKENKRLISNICSLFTLQGANYLLPLISFPYLVRTLGIEYFGLLSFATATITYFSVITDYGFNLIATQEISKHRDNEDKINEIFSSVMTLKVILMFLSFVLLSILVLTIEKFYQDIEIYFLTFGIIIGQVLFPIWFFQGMEKMKYITYLNLFAKSIFTFFIFIFVQSKNDYYIVPLLNSIGFITAGILSLILIKKEFCVKYKLQKTSTLIYYLKEANLIFISNIAVSLYSVSTTFILGFFTNNTSVGYFSAATKIIQAFKGLMIPVSQSIYPFITSKISVSKENGFKFIKKVFNYVFIFTAIISLFIFFSADLLVDILLGKNYTESIFILKIMAVLPFLIGLSNIFGVQTMVTFGRKKHFTLILIRGSLLSLILSFSLVPIYHSVGSAISVVITESFITISMFIYLQNNDLKLLGENSNV
jgi:polysaccharide transporter, PST family